jgi:ABC-type transport system substrate-binding protein
MRSRACVGSAIIAFLLFASVTQLQGTWLTSSSTASSENPGITQVPLGQRGPRVDTLRRKVTESPDAQMVEMTAGPPTGSDVWPGLANHADIEEMYGQEKTVSSQSGFHMCFIGFNYRVHPLDDVNFRHALALLYPRSSIVATMFKYVSVEIRTPVPPAQSLWYNPDVDPHSYSSEEAVDVLAAAGYQLVGGEWKDTDGSNLPTLRFFCPTEATAPTSYTASRRLVEEAQAIGLNNIQITPMDFITYVNMVYQDRDFEIFWICYSLGEFPVHLSEMFHSNNDYPGGRNCYGVNYPDLDELLDAFSTSLDNTARVTAAQQAQELIMGGSTTNPMPDYVAPTDPRTQAIPLIPVYSRSYYDVQQPDLRGAVNMVGYGTENTWTHMNTYWDTANEYRPGTTEKKIVYVEYGFPERLNPLYATRSYSWDYLKDSFDSLVAASPYTHYSEPWLATSWGCEAVPGGMDVTFNLRLTDSQGQPIKWQDGTAISVSNVKFAWDFLRSWQIPEYWSTFRYYDPTNTVIVDADTIRARMTTNNPWLIYDLADTAYMLPPQIWQNNPLTGQPWANQAEILGFDPSAHGGPNGLPTMLYGTGPFILQHSTNFISTNGFGDLTANRNYWMTTQEIIDKISYMFWRAGDVDHNGLIGPSDINAISAAYLTEPGYPLWNPDADITGVASGPPDLRVDTYDLNTAQRFFGETRTVPQAGIADSFDFPLDDHWTTSQRFGGYNYNWGGYHLGEDVLRSFEAPVYAPADGIVKHNAKRTGYGYVVIIEHELLDGTFVCSVLGHLRQAGRAQVGSTVTKGQIVGYLSSQPDENGGIMHLHYGVRKDQYNEELDPDGKWRYRGYGPIDIVGSWCPPSAFIEYYNLNKETPPSYDLTVNTEGGDGASATGTTSVFTLFYKTILSLISFHPWFLQWMGTDNDILNPTTVTMDSPKAVTEIRSTEPPPTPPSPQELAKDALGKVYRTEFGNLATKGWEGGKFVEPPEVDYLDCSGLIFWSYNKAHGSKEYTWICDGADAQNRSNFKTKVSENELLPGDALFFDWNHDGYMDHVAMYVGEYTWTGEIQQLEYYTTGGVLRQDAYQPIVTIENMGDPVEYSGTFNVVHASGDAGHSYGVRPDTVDRLKVMSGFIGFRRFTGPVGAKIKSNSPIDLMVTDPDGFTITKDTPEIPGVLYYLECDIDGDGELEDIVTAPERKVGNYLVNVIPELGASPEDTFTLEASANDTTILLADYARISEVLTDPYIIAQNETSIELRSINIAVIDIMPSKNVVGQGWSSSINVTVQNQGTLLETLNVTLCANTTVIATLSNINLTSGGSATIPFVWSTEGFAKGNYTIVANVTQISGETYIADNTRTFGSVAVTIPGDVDGNRLVSVFDLYTLGKAYDSSPEELNWNSCCDINDDELINSYDLTIVSDNYGLNL